MCERVAGRSQRNIIETQVRKLTLDLTGQVPRQRNEHHTISFLQLFKAQWYLMFYHGLIFWFHMVLNTNTINRMIFIMMCCFIFAVRINLFEKYSDEVWASKAFGLHLPVLKCEDNLIYYS